MTENLFSRLADYGQNEKKRSIENFTTELIAYFFRANIPFRRRFLDHIFEDGRSIRAFQDAFIETQRSFSSNCRVDLVLDSGTRLHLIEVKIGAQETWGRTQEYDWAPQVQRYLDLRVGHVSYLTTRKISPPDTDNRGRQFRFIKHAHFESLYVSLQPLSRDPLISQFLSFMEANDMAPIPPLSPQDIRKADRSLDIYRKCQDTLDSIRSAVGVAFRRNLNTYSALTRPSFSSGSDWTSITSYLRGYRKGPLRSIGLSLDPWEGQLDFNIYIWGTFDPRMKLLAGSIGWREYSTGRGYCSSLTLRGTAGDAERMKRHAIAESRRLGRAIRRLI